MHGLMLPAVLVSFAVAGAPPVVSAFSSLTPPTAATPTAPFFTGTIPYASLSTMTDPAWTTVPYPALLTHTPFCLNEADPDHGVGNHCVCSNGATIATIPWHGGNVSTYQPCAYTTVERPPGYGEDKGKGQVVHVVAETTG